MECDRIVDLQITIDGLILENESVEDFINSLKINSSYPVVYEILYEECIGDG